MSTVHVMKDSNGVMREFNKVARKAKVGEKALAICGILEGKVFTVDYVDDIGVRSPDLGVFIMRLHHRNYVVLQPTNVIHHEGKRYREVERKGFYGDLAIVVDTEHCEAVGCIPRHKVGAVGKVTGRGTRGNRVELCANGKSWYVVDGDYRVLEPIAESPAPAPGTDRITALEKRVAAMAEQLRVAREDIVLIEDGVADDIKRLEAQMAELRSQLTARSETPSTLNVNVTADGLADKVREAFGTLFKQQQPQRSLTRAEVIERAKADVESLFVKGSNGVGKVVMGHAGHNKVEFIVDREKRTVKALLRFAYVSNKKVLRQGTAKCAPDDVFNANIGKAIALRRALGLPVPSEYVKAPQPTEPKVGDVVTGSGEIGRTYYSKDKHFTITRINSDGTIHYAERPSDWLYRSNIGAIIDDTGADA